MQAPHPDAPRAAWEGQGGRRTERLAAGEMDRGQSSWPAVARSEEQTEAGQGKGAPAKTTMPNDDYDGAPLSLLLLPSTERPSRSRKMNAPTGCEPAGRPRRPQARRRQAHCFRRAASESDFSWRSNPVSDIARLSPSELANLRADSTASAMGVGSGADGNLNGNKSAPSDECAALQQSKVPEQVRQEERATSGRKTKTMTRSGKARSLEHGDRFRRRRRQQLDRLPHGRGSEAHSSASPDRHTSKSSRGELTSEEREQDQERRPEDQSCQRAGDEASRVGASAANNERERRGRRDGRPSESAVRNWPNFEQMSERLLVGPRPKWSKPRKMQPPTGRQLVISGSLVLVLLSLLTTTLNWSSLFGGGAPDCSAAPHASRWLCAGSPSRLTISASASEASDVDQESQRQASPDYESSTTRLPPTSSTTAATTNNVPATTRTPDTTTTTTSTTHSPEVEQTRLTTEQTTATLSAPAASSANGDTLPGERLRDEQQATTQKPAARQEAQPAKNLYKKPPAKASDELKFAKGKLKFSPLGARVPPEPRADLKVQTDGWRAIEPTRPLLVRGETLPKLSGRAEASSTNTRYELLGPKRELQKLRPISETKNQRADSSRENHHKLQVPSSQRTEPGANTERNEPRGASNFPTRPVVGEGNLNENYQTKNAISSWTVETAPQNQQLQHPPSNASDQSQLFESALREALDDLLMSAAGEPASKIKQAPRQAPVLPLPFQVALPLPVLDLRHFQRPPRPPQVASSQSAPSISLPPISHFLTPRNPFKLFASASSPAGSRYWPMFGGSSSLSSQAKANPSQQPTTRLFASKSHSQPAASPQQLALPAFDESAALELESISSQLHNQVLAPLSLSGSLFAQSQSAEQLERLVKAASQAGHLPRGAQTILPAIVSGPGGQAFPGFYIPAIDQDTPTPSNQRQPHESTASSFNHFQKANAPYLDSMAAASSSGSSGTPSSGAHPSSGQANDLYSTIPGTDYILHPDEVRAMINIGETVWQKQHQNQNQQPQPQQQQQDHHQQHQTSASNTYQVANRGRAVRQQAERYDHLWQRPDDLRNLMRENHMENLRNYAYVEQGAGPSNEHLHSASSSNDERQFGRAPNGTRQDPVRLLGVHLNRALMRAHSKALPTAIRVNEQDYVHWPLVRLPDQSGAPNGPSGQASAQKPVTNPVPLAAGSQPSQPQLSNFERSPLRLSTQLTPNEIRQVEDSILETLIMAQTLQHQQKVMEALQTAASTSQLQQLQRAPVSRPRWFFKSAMLGGPNGGGFFARRKRRRRNSASAKQQAQSGAVRQQPVSVLPLINPISLFPVGPVLSPAPPAVSVLDTAQRAQQESAERDSEPQQEGESKATKRLPVVMADQETNKPADLASADSLSNVALSTAESAMQSFLSSVGGQSPHGSPISGQPPSADEPERQPPSEATFGSRVRPMTMNRLNATFGQPPTQTFPQHLHNRHAEAKQQTDLRPANQFVAFVPIQNNRDKQISLYMSASRDQRKVDSARQAMHGRPAQHADRFNPVDWPAMVSDADYFPTSHPSQPQNHDRLANRPNSDQDQASGAGQLEAAGLDGAHSKPARTRSHGLEAGRFSGDPNDDDEDGDEHEHEPVDEKREAPVRQPQRAATAQVIRAPSTRRGNLLAGQTKLQFSQDYRVREGVPIYNNNVRIAGALERQRSLEAASA